MKVLIGDSSAKDIKEVDAAGRSTFFSERFLVCCKLMHPDLTDEAIALRRPGDMMYTTVVSQAL